jgi:prepilin-type N-terminal cleavage/methylation domain-containing protein/prepilin-type processing-associated H-X9-DG protein
MRKTKENAFTLIELLVVVAIIALLISILLPSLGRAKESAKKSSCLSNLRQISIAAATYAAKNDNIVVPAAVVYKGAQTDIGYFVLMVDGDLPAPVLGGSASAAPALSFRSVYICPSTPNVDLSGSANQKPGTDGYWWNTSQYWDRNLNVDPNPGTFAADVTKAWVLQSSYGLNGCSFNDNQPCMWLSTTGQGLSGASGKLRKMTGIPRPSDTPFMYDGLTVNPQGGGAAPADVIKRRIAGRHDYPNLSAATEGASGTTNIAFFDGHAEATKRADSPNDQAELGVANPPTAITAILQKHPRYAWRMDE